MTAQDGDGIRKFQVVKIVPEGAVFVICRRGVKHNDYNDCA